MSYGEFQAYLRQRLQERFAKHFDEEFEAALQRTFHNPDGSLRNFVGIEAIVGPCEPAEPPSAVVVPPDGGSGARSDVGAVSPDPRGEQ